MGRKFLSIIIPVKNIDKWEENIIQKKKNVINHQARTKQGRSREFKMCGR